MSEKISSTKIVLGLCITILLTLILLYASRFWIWAAPWSNDGLFGLKLFPPSGDLVRYWLRGTALSVFDIVIWGLGAIAALSFLQSLADRMKK